ncbi:hypothetical protein VTN77DRAFT_6856 [Rasamsonia byssochlamydoides]|uniref:uncharacterized protein n=1 Tax=Rasamsonia byssochlamydoides TaxID=89139 RepID=UPI003743106C
MFGMKNWSLPYHPTKEEDKRQSEMDKGKRLELDGVDISEIEFLKVINKRENGSSSVFLVSRGVSYVSNRKWR